ncbi:hypothetical protein [Amaricoccus sp.]|uniref:hypothetical protein n=1 Tax=Amaricoccus sp. TaxID=1872485 RepID=UPI001B5FB53A|nr:hypothetical protein [Amaricoccus sp.]MBP7243457.1 hypothetical protein [Amaricoccus sp.]
MTGLTPTFRPAEIAAGPRLAELFRWLKARAAAIAAARAARAKERRDILRLRDCDEHVLRDIGITRDSLYPLDASDSARAAASPAQRPVARQAVMR